MAAVRFLGGATAADPQLVSDCKQLNGWSAAALAAALNVALGYLSQAEVRARLAARG